MYKRVEIVQKKIQNSEKAVGFLNDFLEDNGQSYDEFIRLTVPEILRKHLSEEFTSEEIKERERAEKKMLEQLKELNSHLGPDSAIDNVSRATTSRLSSVGNERTPDFMNKFTSDSEKLITENLSDLYGSQPVYKNDNDKREIFTNLVFDTESQSNIVTLQRGQLRQSMLKSN